MEIWAGTPKKKVTVLLLVDHPLRIQKTTKELETALTCPSSYSRNVG